MDRQALSEMDNEEILAYYQTVFHPKVENTPEYILSIADESGGIDFAMPLVQQHPFWMEMHAAMGMVGEAGEILEPYKKMLFGKRHPVDKQKMLLELGDLFWYFTLYLRASGIPLRDVVEANILKLSDRYGVPL